MFLFKQFLRCPWTIPYLKLLNQKSRMVRIITSFLGGPKPEENVLGLEILGLEYGVTNCIQRSPHPLSYPVATTEYCLNKRLRCPENPKSPKASTKFGNNKERKKNQSTMEDKHAIIFFFFF